MGKGIKLMELIQTQEPDLIILDLVMPSLDGFGVLERLNSQTTMKRPKVIMLTAFGQESLTHQAMMLGNEHNLFAEVTTVMNQIGINLE